MADYVETVLAMELAGIPLRAWQQFLSLFTEQSTDETIEAGLRKLTQQTDN